MGADTPLAAADEVDGGIVGAEAFGRAAERQAFEGLQEGFEFFAGEDLAELGVVVDEVAADGEELLALGHVDAGGDDDFVGADVEVEASAGGLFEAGAGPPCSLVRFVRAFVGAEARVAVDAEECLLRRAYVFGGEGEHGLVDLGDEREHGSFDLALVGGLAIVEPGAVVVALEAAEELDRFGGKVSGHDSILMREAAGWRGEKSRSLQFRDGYFLTSSCRSKY